MHTAKIAWLRKHGIMVLGCSEHWIAVVSEWTLDTIPGHSLELIPATQEAIDNWLGY